ncbi:CRISPR-associated protein, Cse2 family [Coriobacterium glomerans PW2]|uniref:CRISPR-associated protein, Cse2 family n=1 Tax=Coriobacterium glomerans (strain ATCC 49209 / DSM 20642 / JCM 10262 / PW2) TaxID=700015 RepID=F2NAL3_CORGP|nr:type I-E CRISPR-associated protein Cse2/CasB [Coriobacterium glomerans]AEB06540.1 CRISPR-associated protein, Cse2 family [Coriobacterium glomerans PW2]
MSNTYEVAGKLGAFAARKIQILQRDYLGSGSRAAHARSVLAQLRRLHEPGSSTWIMAGRELFENWPELDLGPSEETRALRAVATSFKFYAIHQQSNTVGMSMPHKKKDGAQVPRRNPYSFGQACRQIDPDIDRSGAIRRRLASIEAAYDFEGIAYHMRGLIKLMSSKQIGLDYFSLIKDLYLVQCDGLKDRVLIDWSRAYFGSLETEPQKAAAIEIEKA